MLLLEPPMNREDWLHRDTGDPRFLCRFSHYCDCYRSAVLSLPGRQVAKVVAYLVRGYEEAPVTPESLRLIVERELDEGEFEACEKAARLVLLCALVDSLAEDDLQVDAITRRLCQLCEQIIPEVLLLAVDDHFGLLTTAS